MRSRVVQGDERMFRSVAEAVRVFGVSEMTLYRAIREGQFPAVRIMGRLIVPLKAIDAMVDAAVESGSAVDAADWVDPAALARDAGGSVDPAGLARSVPGRAANRFVARGGDY